MPGSGISIELVLSVVGIVLLVLLFVMLLVILGRLGRIERALSGREGAAGPPEGEKVRAETSSGGVFEEFLSEDPGRQEPSEERAVCRIQEVEVGEGAELVGVRSGRAQGGPRRRMTAVRK